MSCLVLACLKLAAAQPVAGPSEVPALAPALAPTSPDACGQCEYPVSGALGANITFRTVADTARSVGPWSTALPSSSSPGCVQSPRRCDTLTAVPQVLQRQLRRLHPGVL